MIRGKEFPVKRIPHSLLKELRERANETHISQWWIQLEVQKEELRQWCAKTIGIDEESLKNRSIVFHRIRGSVPTHCDNESRSCKLIPLRAGKNTKLYVHGESFDSERQLKPYHFYTFNDFNPHGLQNEESCICEVITVS